MIIRQLSIFLENRTGRINEVARILADNGINMQAFSMAETADFGILRLIVSDVERAAQILRDADFAVMMTDVVCISRPNVAGSLSEIMEILAEQDIFIEYMYAFAQGDLANVVIRPTDIERCVEVLSGCECDMVRGF